MLSEALSPQKPCPKPQPNTLTIDRQFLQRAIVTLATALPGTIRGIQRLQNCSSTCPGRWASSVKAYKRLTRKQPVTMLRWHCLSLCRGSGRDISRSAALSDGSGWTLLSGVASPSRKEARCYHLGNELPGTSRTRSEIPRYFQ